jgi:hypothetical protein
LPGHVAPGVTNLITGGFPYCEAALLADGTADFGEALTLVLTAETAIPASSHSRPRRPR